MRAAKWVFWSAIGSTALYLAVNGSEGGMNMFVFFAWLGSLCSIVCAFTDSVRTKMRVKGRSVPAWVAQIVGYSWMFVCAWHGMYWTAVVIFLGEIAEAGIYDNDEEVGV